MDICSFLSQKHIYVPAYCQLAGGKWNPYDLSLFPFFIFAIIDLRNVSNVWQTEGKWLMKWAPHGANYAGGW